MVYEIHTVYPHPIDGRLDEPGIAVHDLTFRTAVDVARRQVGGGVTVELWRRRDNTMIPIRIETAADAGDIEEWSP